MSGLVGNHEDRYSHDAALITLIILLFGLILSELIVYVKLPTLLVMLNLLKVPGVIPKSRAKVSAQ